jgi:DNA repair exonuclease SbcCD ATPase subunit
MGKVVNKNSKLDFHWKVSPYDYSKEKLNNLIIKASKKYNVPREQIKITPDFIMIDEKGENISITNDVIENIQDIEFQQKLFMDYIKTNDIKDYDFSIIKGIDDSINSEINFKSYDKYRKLTVKWIKWDNFLSYGENNYFDFTPLKNLVLLNGEPANQSGKTTFAVDLIHFLFFGKTTKAETLDKVFNKHLNDATTVLIEGCISINGEDYIIKRTITRPAADKRTAKSKSSQKIQYYKIVGGEREELEDADIESKVEESSQKTNKIIKEAIGNESDFDLIMSVTENTLDSLIEEKPTERGKLLSRWIGLLPLEEKEEVARTRFNSAVKPSFLLNQYDSEQLKQEIEGIKKNNEDTENQINSLNISNQSLAKEIAALEETKNALLQSKQKIDENLLLIDITTLNSKMEEYISNGKKKAQELNKVDSELKELGDVDFSVDEYDEKVNSLSEANQKLAVLKSNYKRLKELNEQLLNSEYCPVCKRKLDGVDNSAHIKEHEKEMEKISEEGQTLNALIETLTRTIEKMKGDREKYTRINILTAQKSALELNVEKLRTAWKDASVTKKNYEQNADAIDTNNRINISINNTEAKLSTGRKTREMNSTLIGEKQNIIVKNNDDIKKKENIIEKLKEENILLRNWKIYLDIIGKNGISKMILRKALPIINARLVELLDGVCDFDVEVVINNKSEVTFNLIKDGISSNLSSGSGFEKTAAALALRSVLADISTIPRLNFIVLDELLGRVAKENYDNIRTLYDRMLRGYDFIIQITHLDEVKDWHDFILTVTKEGNVSKITTTSETVIK